MAANELEKTIPYYDPENKESLVKMGWDWVQPNLGCCGVQDWQDWNAAEKLQKTRQKVPESCCRGSGRPDCNVYSPSSGGIFMEGCLEKITLPFRITFWAIPSIMAFVLFSALIVCSRQKNRERMHNKNR